MAAWDQHTAEYEIVHGRPIAVAFDVTSSFLNKWGDASPVTSEWGDYEFSHSMTIVGYNEFGVLIQNSWGDGWGANGRIWVSWGFLASAPNGGTSGADLVISSPHLVKAKPKPFPAKKWDAYRSGHHLSLISPWLHHHLRWQAKIWRSNQYLRGVKGIDRWFPAHKGQRYGYSKMPFSKGSIFTWPQTHHFKVVSGRRVKHGGKLIALPAAPRTQTFRAPPHMIVYGGQRQAWYVKSGIKTRDTGVNISPIVNAAGDRYRIPPVGILAMLGTESSINQFSDWWGAWPDVSFGICQVSVETANQYGVQGDADTVRVWENNLHNCIWLSARILRSFENQACIPFPYLYVAYNTGPGYGCNADWYYHPTGQAASNFNNFLTWWSWAQTQGWRPPHPKFKLGVWYGYANRHHLKHRPLSPNYHGHRSHTADLWWANGHWKRCRGIVNHEQFFRGHHGRRGFITVRFSICRLYWWPGTKWHKIIHVRRIQ